MIDEKLQMTRRSQPITNAVKQYVDFYGKRRMYLNTEGNIIYSLGRPIDCKTFSFEPHLHESVSNVNKEIKSIGTQRHILKIPKPERKERIGIKYDDIDSDSDF